MAELRGSYLIIGDVQENLVMGRNTSGSVYILREEGRHQGSNDSGHVFRTFNNRIFIILNTCGILYGGNFFIAEECEDNYTIEPCSDQVFRNKERRFKQVKESLERYEALLLLMFSARK